MELREDHPPPNEAISNKKNRKKRFTDEQIRLMESIFQSESRLKPRKNLQVARELGLQPRQVAIWFQNRRARLKSKQIEKDYIRLRDKYDNLTSRFESLKNEKQCLVSQMEKLSEMVAETHAGNKAGKAGLEAEAEPVFRQTAMEDNNGVFSLEEFMNMDEYRTFPVPTEKPYGFDSADMSDYSCGRLFWT